jgi:hypothetical protein
VGAFGRFLTHVRFFLTNPFLHVFFAPTHVCRFLTNPFLHFFFASTALREPPASAAAVAAPAGTASAAAAKRSVASRPAPAFRASRIVVVPFLAQGRSMWTDTGMEARDRARDTPIRV